MASLALSSPPNIGTASPDLPPGPKPLDIGIPGRDSRREDPDDGRVEYLVSWRGYPGDEDAWEPAESLTHALVAVADWRECEPPKASPLPKRTNSVAVSNENVSAFAKIDSPCWEPSQASALQGLLFLLYIPFEAEFRV
jgi:hypothetical protein